MASLYDTLRERLRSSTGSTDVWRRIRESLNPALYRPTRDPRVESHVVDDRRKPPYVVIKQPDVHAYLRLAAEERFLWESMDGSRTVKDLILAYFTQFGSLALGRVGGLVTHLRQRQFLRDKTQDVFGAVYRRLPVVRGRRMAPPRLPHP